MMRGLLAAFALFSAAPAAAENWHEVTGVDVEAKFWIDLDSIRTEASITHFRTRVLIGDFKGFAFVDSVADCAGKTVEMRHVDLIQDGKILSSKDFEPGSSVQSLEDEQGLIVQALVCKR